MRVKTCLYLCREQPLAHGWLYALIVRQLNNLRFMRYLLLDHDSATSATTQALGGCNC